MRETISTAEEVHVPIPGYIEKFLVGIAKKIGKTKEEVALFFLAKEAEHAQQPKEKRRSSRTTND